MYRFLTNNCFFEKLLQYATSIGFGILVAFESSLNFFVPCLIVVAIDIWSAYCLGKRLHKKWPDRYSGKFKSEYKTKILKTMLLILVVLIAASHVDEYVLRDPEDDLAVRACLCIFFFYQVWSILENWSSENDNKIAKSLQRIMVNKAERHLDVELKDIFFNEGKKK